MIQPESKFKFIEGLDSEAGFDFYNVSFSPFYGTSFLLKTLIDKLFSIFFILISLPLILVFSILILLEDGFPIFFKQRRTGWDGKSFNILKLRSIKNMKNKDETKQVKAGDSRLLNVGKIIRRLSIDELPQFFNVLKGDMSIVGPRPHMVDHTKHYSKEIQNFMQRHKCLPGLTGWAQVNGLRGPTEEKGSMDKRFQYDLYYVDRGDAGSFGCYDMTTHAVDCLATSESECADGSGWYENVCAANPDRRGQYLTVASSLLSEHLTGLQEAWAPDAENYRADFLALSSEEQLANILTGMIILSGFETGGERLQTALDSGDQEDEHSCFSDNTHRDMIQDVQGVQNVYLGTYGSVSGTSIKDIVAEQDAELADRLESEIAASLAAGNALQPPFDQEIASDNAEGRARVQALIDALRTQEATLEEVFRLFELDVPVAE